MRRVVITGLGPVSSIGIGAQSYLAGLRAGTSGVSAITSFDTDGFVHRMAGEVHDFRPDELVRRIAVKEWGRASLFAAAAARLAWTDAGLTESDIEPARAGSCMGTMGGESLALEHATKAAVDGGGFGAADPRQLGQVSAAQLSTAVNRELGFAGAALTLANACSASNYALGYGYDMIRTGELDQVVAGGADSVMRWSHAGFHRLGAVADEICSPFDRDRSGIITAEGGAALLLESADAAESRGARIYAEVLGYGTNCDAHHMVAPHRASIAECIRLAHRNAGVTPADVDYICAHGTGTPANDLTEAHAIADVFGDRLPPVSSIKSMLGHTMGAASGLGVIASALAIYASFLPPTTNFVTPDPDFPDLDPVPNRARSAPVRTAQVNGFAFGGNNAIVMLGRPA